MDMKIFKVGENEKCGSCNWKVWNTYLLAENEEEAKKIYKDCGNRGLCADCLVELLIEEGYEIVR